MGDVMITTFETTLLLIPYMVTQTKIKGDGMEKGIQIQAEREDSKIDAINHEDIVTLDI